jgi:hypothetical protein
MKRRELMLLLGGAMTAARGLRAQQKTMPVIGYLSIGSPGPYAPLTAAFRQGLSETGYVEGQNVAIEYRWAEGRYDRLPALAADLVGRKVDVIAAGGGCIRSCAAPVGRARFTRCVGKLPLVKATRQSDIGKEKPGIALPVRQRRRRGISNRWPPCKRKTLFETAPVRLLWSSQGVVAFVIASSESPGDSTDHGCRARATAPASRGRACV